MTLLHNCRRISGWHKKALTLALCATSLTTQAFDFEQGNAAIEVVIPTAIPTIFAAVKPGDAPLVLRFTTLLTNSWFDATASYHPTALAVYSRLPRRPASEYNNTNINTAILCASYRTLTSLFPAKKQDWRQMLLDHGLNPDTGGMDLTEPCAIGMAAAEAMLAVREQDGMNQLGTLNANPYQPMPYADYTGYAPVNSAFALTNPSRWQPAAFTNPYGTTTVQQFITPQYAKVIPYSFSDATEFNVPPPAKSQWTGSHKRMGPAPGNGPNTDYVAQADAVLHASANMSDEQKMIAELFDNKIQSLGFSSLFAALSRQLSVLEFVHYDFLVNVAAFDAGIVIWQEKTKYDAVRPFSAIHLLYGDSTVTAWGGPGAGTVADLPGKAWNSYLPVANHPEYPSGSTGFCEAHAQASRLFFASDALGWQVPVAAGSSVIEPGITPASDLLLSWDSWTDFANDCGNSRFWSGVHFTDAIDNMRPVARDIGSRAYQFVQNHINGTVN